MTFGDQLRKARGSLTQLQAAKILGVSLGAVEKWERGERKPATLAVPELERRLRDLEKRQPKARARAA